MCAMKVERVRGRGMGAFLMDDADFSMLPPRIVIFQMLGGRIMFLSFLMMLIMLPFRLFDALIRLTVVSVILPLVVFAYQFKPTRGAVKQAATSVLAAGLTFFFTALARSEEHTSELQSLMRISYAVFCLKKKTLTKNPT